MSRKLTEEQVQEKVHKAHGDMVKLVPGTYGASSRLALFIDEELGEFKCRPTHVFRGHGHPKRGIMKNVALRIIPISVIKEKLKELYGDEILLDEFTYTKTRKSARFIDIKHGEFWAIPQDVLCGHLKTRKQERFLKSCIERYGVANPSQMVSVKSKKRQTFKINFQDNPEAMLSLQDRYRKTNLERYGYEFPAQNPMISLKSSKSSFYTIERLHWKTNEILICRGGWEVCAIDYLNLNKIDYNFQCEVFRIPKNKLTTPKGRMATYRPDLFLIKDNKWIEIKGWLDRNLDSKNKWLWFHETYPNSELWDKIKLKELGIQVYTLKQLKQKENKNG